MWYFNLELYGLLKFWVVVNTYVTNYSYKYMLNGKFLSDLGQLFTLEGCGSTVFNSYICICIFSELFDVCVLVSVYIYIYTSLYVHMYILFACVCIQNLDVHIHVYIKFAY